MINGCFGSYTANFVNEGQTFDLTPARATALTVSYWAWPALQTPRKQSQA